jgi:hypothetical protein
MRRAVRRLASRFIGYAAVPVFISILVAFPMAADAQCVSAAQILAGSPFPLCSVPASVPPSGLSSRVPSGIMSGLAPGVQLLPQLFGVLGALGQATSTGQASAPARAAQAPTASEDPLTRQLSTLLKPCTASAWQGDAACRQAQEKALNLVALYSKTQPIMNPSDVPSYVEYGSNGTVDTRWRDGLRLNEAPGRPPQAENGSTQDAQGRLCRAEGRCPAAALRLVGRTTASN